MNSTELFKAITEITEQEELAQFHDEDEVDKPRTIDSGEYWWRK